MNLAAGIQVAQLALKHRQNKKQQQRIIVFAGRFIIPSHAFLFIFLFAILLHIEDFDLGVFQSCQT